MSETIRKEIEGILDKVQHFEIGEGYATDAILALFPKWRTFSPDCLPDKGKKEHHFLVRSDPGFIPMRYKRELDKNYIDTEFQFFEIPNE